MFPTVTKRSFCRTSGPDAKPRHDANPLEIVVIPFLQRGDRKGVRRAGGGGEPVSSPLRWGLSGSRTPLRRIVLPFGWDDDHIGTDSLFRNPAMHGGLLGDPPTLVAFHT